MKFLLEILLKRTATVDRNALVATSGYRARRRCQGLPTAVKERKDLEMATQMRAKGERLEDQIKDLFEGVQTNLPNHVTVKVRNTRYTRDQLHDILQAWLVRYAETEARRVAYYKALNDRDAEEPKAKAFTDD